MRNLVACMLLLGSALPAADLGGTWFMEQAGRSGSQARKTYYYFKVEGNSFTGQMVSSTDNRQVQNGKIDGDTITFETLGAFNDRPNQMRAVFNGEELTISGVGGRGGRGGPGGSPPSGAPPTIQVPPFMVRGPGGLGLPPSGAPGAPGAASGARPRQPPNSQ